jgi:Catalytic LigB subunit of aromatic ring-opening dioxygenase
VPSIVSAILCRRGTTGCVAEIVAAIGVPHGPALPAEVEQQGPNHPAAQLFSAVRSHLDAVQPDVLIIFDSDHLNTFFLDNLPMLSVGVTDCTSGPNDGTRMPHYAVAVNEALAQAIRVYGINSDFDLGVSQEFEVDHSILVPLHFLTPRMQVPIVPIFIGGIVPPLPLAKRCFALGQMVREAVSAWPEQLRVGILASGSISLDIGGPLAPHGRIAGVADAAWVDEVLGYLQRAAFDDLLNAATADRLARAGNIGGELLNWIALLGALGPRRPVLLETLMAHGDGFAAWRWD